MKKATCVDDVLVVWCATHEPHGSRVIGWYNNATVFRNYQEDEDEYLFYNSCAKAADCVLLPRETRFESEWEAPRSKAKGYGFGQSNVWYPANYPEAQGWLKDLISSISNYKGDNWIKYNLPVRKPIKIKKIKSHSSE